MKRLLALGVLILVLLALGVSFYLYRKNQHSAPKHVWVDYSEKYKSEDYEKQQDNHQYAEEQLQQNISAQKGCIVITHERQKADYVVNISVTRFLGGDLFGEAALSITEQNGDVVVADHFYQDRNSKEDIAMQPITAGWDWFCKKPL